MMPPLAYFITWSTYGSWLPGDERGWVKKGESGVQAGDEQRRADALSRMKETPVSLTVAQRAAVEATIRRHCEIRKWTLHAVNARAQHVHVVVTADRDPDTVREQLKAWCTRKLNELNRGLRRENWWTEGGSARWVNDAQHLLDVIAYVLEKQ